MIKIDCIYQPTKESRFAVEMFSVGKNYLCTFQSNTGFQINAIINPCAVWGILRGGHKIIEMCEERHLDYYYLDNKYVSKGYIRVTKNRAQAGKIIQRPDDRWKQLNIELDPWRKTGRNIVICPPTEAMITYYKLENWVENIRAEIQKYTDRPIVLRYKPTEICVELDENNYIIPTEKPKKYEGPFKSFDDELADAHAIVTFNSNVAVEAIYKGIPCFVSPVSAAAPISNNLFELNQIETPRYEDREPWLHHLAYSQFNRDDFLSGTAFEILEGI